MRSSVLRIGVLLLASMSLWFCRTSQSLPPGEGEASTALTSLEVPLPPFPQALDFAEPVLVRLRNAYQVLGDAKSDANSLGEASQLLHAHHLESLALPGYVKAFSKDSHAFQWAYLAGVAAKANGLDEVAKTAFTTARRLNPGHIPSAVEWAEFALQEHRHEEARTVFAGILEGNPNHTMALWGLAQIELLQGHHARAAELLEKVVTQDPQATMVYYPLAQAQQALGQTERAKESLAKRGNGRPSMPDPIMEAVLALETTVVGFRRAGDQALRDGAFGEAISKYGEALKLDPKDAPTYLNRGWAHAYQQNLPAAIQDWNLVLQLSDQSLLRAQAHYNLGQMEQWQNQVSGALVQYQKAVELHPAFGGAKLALAEVLRGLGQFAKAEPLYQDLVEQNPGDPVPRMGRALCRIRMNRFEEALAGLAEDVSAQPQQATFLHMRIRLLVTASSENLRNGKLALAMFEQLTQSWSILDSGLAETGAMILAELGKFPEAMRMQQRALALAREEGEPKQTQDRLLANLENYLNQRACRMPWPDDAILFTQPLRQMRPMQAPAGIQD